MENLKSFGSTPPRIVVLGGGIAGLTVATNLGTKLARRGKASVVLVDKSHTHVWKPMLHRFAAGTMLTDNDRVDLALQAHRRGFQFWPSEIVGTNRTKRVIEIGPGVDQDKKTLQYDALVVAIGSRANDFSTPGVSDHCMFIDNPVEADAFNNAFRKGLLRSFAEGLALTIAIVGGGATGVQLAAELLKAKALSSFYNFGASEPALDITLLEATDRILPAFSEAVSRDAASQLRSLGVKVLTSAKVIRADETGLTLEDGKRIDASLRVWVAGVRAPAATSVLDDLELNRSGQLMVRPSLQATRDDRIFGIGDCARVIEHPLPATAQVAHQQALHLSAHIPEWVDGVPIPSFSFSNRGSVVELGDSAGWLLLPDGRVVGGDGWRGLPARLTHSLLYKRHQIALYGPARGSIACLAEWLNTFVLPPVRLS